MNNTRYKKGIFILKNQFLFWFLVLLCSFLFKDLKQDLIIDIRDLFYKGPINTINAQDLLKNINNLHLGKFISALFAWTFIFSYYHSSSIIINNTYSPLFNIVSRKIRVFLKIKVLFFFLIAAIICYLTLDTFYINNTIFRSIILILYFINFSLFYYFLKDAIRKYYLIVTLFTIIFITSYVYTVYTHLNIIQTTNILSALLFTLFLTCFYTCFIIFPYILVTIVLIYVIYNIGRAEYLFATLGKEVLENNLRFAAFTTIDINYPDGNTYKLKDFFSLYKKIKKSKTKGNYVNVVNELIQNAELTDAFKNRLIDMFNSIKISKPEIQKKRTNYVKSRNQINLFLSIVTTIISVSLPIVYIYFQNISIAYMKNLLFIIYIFVFLRLLSRSIEICIAFYKDVIAKKSLKNTLLTGTDRISLALTSILETIFTVTTLSIIETLYSTDLLDILRANYDFPQLFKLICFNFSNSMATSLFNVSFPGTGHQVTILTLSHQVIHLMQIIISLTLITLSIANYINLPKYSYYYELRYINKELNLYKVFHNNSVNHEKLVLSSHDIQSFHLLLYSSWKLGNLTDTDFLEIKEFLNDYQPHK